MSRLIIVAVLDEYTPEICAEADHKEIRAIWEYPPHDTGDPDNPCRCTVVRTAPEED